MLLVDKVENLIPGQSATGIKCVTINEPYFTGHFPDNPIMPGVLIIEAMAQTAGIVTLVNVKRPVDAVDVYFMAIESAKFRKPVIPGDVIELQVELIKNKSNVWKFSGKALVKGALHAQATFMVMMSERTNDRLK